MEIIQRPLLSKTISLLPKEYQCVNWLESTGTQYIDTNYKWTHPISFKIRAQKTGSEQTYVFGAVGTTTSTNIQYGGRLSLNANNGLGTQFTAQGYYNQYQGFTYVKVGDWCEVELECGSVTINGTTKTFTANNKSSDFNIVLFGLNDAGTVKSSLVRVSSFQIYTGDVEPVIVRNLIPCYRKSDGVVGMYDQCGSICPLTGTPFYINAGTGEFLKGDDV